MANEEIYCSRLEKHVGISVNGHPKCEYFDLVSTKCMQQSKINPLPCFPYHTSREQSSAKCMTAGMAEQVERILKDSKKQRDAHIDPRFPGAVVFYD